MAKNKRLSAVRLANADISPLVQVMAYGDNVPDNYVEQQLSCGADNQTVDLSPLTELLAKSPSVTWINVDGRGTPELLAAIGKVFDLHPLALEDVANTQQRVKIEQYGRHYFVVCRMVSATPELDSEQLSMFVGKGFVVTFQEKADGDCLDTVRQRIRGGLGRIRHLGADHLAYAIIDAVVDGYFPVLTELENKLEVLELELESEPALLPDPALPGKIHAVRGEILELRRTIGPMRDAIHGFSRSGPGLVSEETQIHLRDCYDHTLRIFDLLETLREVCLGLRELYQTRVSNYLSVQSQQTNEVMKILAIITTLFTPLTFIAGIYGMNFNPDKSPWNMPELNWFYGYPFAIGLMVVIFLGLLFFLYRRGWLFTQSPAYRKAARSGDGKENK